MGLCYQIAKKRYDAPIMTEAEEPKLLATFPDSSSRWISKQDVLVAQASGAVVVAVQGAGDKAIPDIDTRNRSSRWQVAAACIG